MVPSKERQGQWGDSECEQRPSGNRSRQPGHGQLSAAPTRHPQQAAELSDASEHCQRGGSLTGLGVSRSDDRESGTKNVPHKANLPKEVFAVQGQPRQQS